MRGFIYINKRIIKKYIWLAVLVMSVISWHILSHNLSQPIQDSQARLVPIYFVDTTEKKIAISFDACWGATETPEILKILRDHNLKTTFFLTGFWVDKYPEMVQKIAEEGHEIGNHTYSHPHLNSLSEEQIKEELEVLNEMIFKLIGRKPYLFRPSYGEYNNKVIATAKRCGYQSIQWSIDSLDWQELGKETMIKRVTENLHPGAIVLFHNNGKYTAEALPEIIDFIKAEGYKILPISELI